MRSATLLLASLVCCGGQNIEPVPVPVPVPVPESERCERRLVTSALGDDVNDEDHLRRCSEWEAALEADMSALDRSCESDSDCDVVGRGWSPCGLAPARRGPALVQLESCIMAHAEACPELPRYKEDRKSPKYECLYNCVLCVEGACIFGCENRRG